MTSLDQQLRKLAVPQTSALLGDQKQRASLLFDKSEAATLSKEALFAIGINGLQELENIDPKFQIYEKNLFDEASQTFERAQHSKEANIELDKTIEEFLIRLSPYFLLRASTKALEWLIYRYRIHMNNVDAILSAIFPYYSTPGFVKVLQTFRLGQKTGRWFWLKPSKDHGAALSRNAVLNQVMKDPNFLSFVCNIVPKHLQVHGTDAAKSMKNVVSFFTSTLVGALSIGHLKETTVSTILPTLLGGFKSKCSDYKASAYIITGQLTSVEKLDKKLLESLMSAMTKTPGTLTKEMLLCLLVVCQCQDVERLSKKVARHICRVEALAQYLENMSEKYQTYSMLKLLFDRLIPLAIKESYALVSSSDDSDEGGSRPHYVSLLESMLQGWRVNDKLAVHIAKIIVERFEVHEDSPDMVRDKIFEYFKIIEKKYPNAVDDLLKNLDDDQYLKKLLAHTNHDVVVGLNHANAEVRKLAVEKLVRIEDDSDKESVEEHLLSRLKDESVEVVKAVLGLEKLNELVSEEALVGRMVNLMDKHYDNLEWKEVIYLCLQLLLDHWPNYDVNDVVYWQIYTRILPYLLGGPKNKSKESVELIMKSKMATSDPVLKNLPKLSTDVDVSYVASSFCDLMSRQPEDYREKFLSNLMKPVHNDQTKYVYASVALRFLIEVVIHQKGQPTQYLPYCQYAIEIIRESLSRLSGKASFEEKCLSIFDVESSPELLCRGLTTVIRQLKCPKSLKDEKWWSFDLDKESELFLVLMMDLLELLRTHMNAETAAGEVFRKCSSAMKNSCLSKTSTFFSLVGAVFSGHASLTPVHQLQALYLAKMSLSKASTVELNRMLSPGSVTVPCLVLALNSEYKPVRDVACSIMEELVSRTESSAYQSLCRKLITVSEELKTSGEYLPEAISAIYSEDSEKKKSRRKSSAEIGLLKQSMDDLMHVVCSDRCPSTIVEGLLNCLSLVSGSEILIELMPLLESLIEKLTLGLTESETRCVHLLVQRFTPQVVHVFKDNTMVKELFFKCLQSSEGHFEEYISVQKLSLKLITKDFYNDLPSDELRQSLLTHVLDTWVEVNDADLNRIFNKKLKSLNLNVEHVSIELRKLLPESFSTVKETKRGRRRTIDSRLTEKADNVFETRSWKRAILVLEIVQNKKKMANVEKLTPDLFSVLKFAIQQEDQASADYFKQLVLSCLLMIYRNLLVANTKLEDLEAHGSKLNVELVIQCIRTSENSQTYNHALILLSTAVQLDPEGVLHNVMSIFTFMGANIMRQDDSYSFKVLTDTVDGIIPALLKAGSEEDTDSAAGQIDSQLLGRLKINAKLASSVRHILQVFVDTYPHIPQHRRLSLFVKLMEKLKPNRFMWLLMVLMIDTHTVRHRDKPEEEIDSDQKVDEFCLGVCDSFSIEAKIGTARKLLMFVNTEMRNLETREEQPKPRKSGSVESSHLMDFSRYKLKEMKMLKYGIVGFVAQLLSGVDAGKSDRKQGDALVKMYEKTMEECLIFITAIGAAMANETNTYWQALLAGAYRILDHLQALLKHDVFVRVVGGLIGNDLAIIRRKTMELLVNKLSTPKFNCEPEQVEAFLDLMPRLAKASRSVSVRDDSHAGTANRQAALLALRAMCRCFGAQNAAKFQKLLPLVSKLISEECPVTVKSAAVALLAELVTCLRAHAVSSLSSFMPGLIRILRMHREQSPGADTLLPNSIVAVLKIVEVLPNFISPYLCQLLTEIFWLSSRYSQQDVDQKTNIAHRLLTVRKHLSKDVPTRVFLPNLTSCFKELSEVDQWRAIQPIMSTLSDHVANMTPEDIVNYHTSILNLFLTSLDFRVVHADLESDIIVNTEEHINEAVNSLVMKLSESTFRPLFYRLYDWATNTEAPKDRLLTFYHLCNALAAKMKNLFSKFAGHVLPNIAVLLDANNSQKTEQPFFTDDKASEKACELLVHTIDVLQKCFLYDNEGFVTKERFDTMMPPLVCQLENMLGGIDLYRRRISEHLVPCLVQLAVAAGDDGSWKPLNYQVCLKTRHADPSVRFAALQILQSLHDKLGADYMSLLPETIQFLAELTEDENHEVEQKCHDVIKHLEKTLGEPLSKYF